MKDEIFFRDKLEDEWEANEVYAILSEWICVRMASVEKRGRYEKNLKSDCNDSLSLIFVTF